ncbi:YvrJ family protein [Virgibacillus ihumii]|uniref:YvrJ family protein n=1 Tax=Virgibacillus ihumii TaxID=2686091 RepID=UPI001FE55CA0|nr:YvrJ family protein [Virgibacillus ihumii]
MSEIANLSSMMQILANFGFPVLITLILLFRFEARVQQLEESHQELTETIHELRRDYHD